MKTKLLLIFAALVIASCTLSTECKVKFRVHHVNPSGFVAIPYCSK